MLLSLVVFALQLATINLLCKPIITTHAKSIITTHAKSTFNVTIITVVCIEKS